MKKYVFVCMAVCMLLSGCTSQTENTGSVQNVEGIQKVTAVTEVFGDGQKVSAAILEYTGEIDAASLAVDDFEVENRTIESIQTNSEAAIPEESVPGKYVILNFLYENSESAENMNGGRQLPEGAEERDSGMTPGEAGGRNEAMERGRDEETDGGKLRGEERPDGGQMQNGGQNRQSENDLSVSVTQKGQITGTDGTLYTESDTAVESSDRIDLIVQDFQLLEYTDPETGCTIPYSLYLPKDYDESREYPLVFFVADASANGDDPTRNLTQGNGAVIWASPEEQAKHECIVLAPQYTNTLIDSIGALTTDDNVWTDGLTLVSNLLHYVIEEYSVDEDRIYGTGQSQGCMTNIALSDQDPDLFAAQLLVAGQWNVEEMAAMKDKNLWIVVCEGDAKAYPGMNEATESWEALGTSVARSELWDSTSTPEQFDELVEQMEAQQCKINYTVFAGGSHTYTWSVAYNIEGIRDWLFAQEKESLS